jgi:hypothetical protein
MGLSNTKRQPALVKDGSFILCQSCEIRKAETTVRLELPGLLPIERKLK